MGGTCCKDVNGEGSKFENEIMHSQRIVVQIVGVRGLQATSDSIKSDHWHYVTLSSSADAGELFTTTTKKNMLDPVFNEETGVLHFTHGDIFEFNVWEATDGDTRGKVVAKAVLNSGNYGVYGFIGELELMEDGKHIAAYLRAKVRLDGNEYPCDAMQEVHIQLDNPDKKGLGLTVDPEDGSTVLVTRIGNGPVQQHNKDMTAKPHKQMRPGDFIIAANGNQGNAKAIIKVMNSGESVTLVARRPAEFRVPVRLQDSQKLGLKFPPTEDPHSLLVDEIRKGFITEWNNANPSQQVRRLDRIVSVNGERRKPSEMIDMMKNSKSYYITFLRPADAMGTAEEDNADQTGF
eukprot:CAMPEP_0171064142 /NCGR_PEP_ID=MMETSP0766_2-20121228/6104_1 /TAXON_ID=439317 /ORGANISM="Gambierdiscus australes, Strain CAWD 149" /LENGTH=347 /DNA_ID=CAMNT_0011520143 /DNA_START=16 /DNA_END=1059 /DNA_ORIENTATION=-